MARQKRLHPFIVIAQAYLSQHFPELRNTPVHLHVLDGPPGSPRYAATAEVCSVNACPHGIPTAIAAAGQCGVRSCPLRRTARLLLDQRGTVLQVTHSDLHWK